VHFPISSRARLPIFSARLLLLQIRSPSPSIDNTRSVILPNDIYTRDAAFAHSRYAPLPGGLGPREEPLSRPALWRQLGQGPAHECRQGEACPGARALSWRGERPRHLDPLFLSGACIPSAISAFMPHFLVYLELTHDRRCSGEVVADQRGARGGGGILVPSSTRGSPLESRGVRPRLRPLSSPILYDGIFNRY
jgi:hypothetical protein